ncbi:MAG: hypothetical protein J5517_06610 [Eubacterium sp.]|nr:hypothetical protein [Eubacterium sp.]
MKSLIVVLGGVTSGVGKGVVCASIGNLLIEKGIKTTVIKYDGLMNYSFEQMNPYHVIPEVRWSDEEVTVLADGGVVDSDLGVYERFTGLDLSTANNIVNGQCLKELISYQDGNRWKIGEVISVFPHLIEIYKGKLFEAIADNDVAVLEVGGTVGDFESEFFLRMVSDLSAELNLFVVQLSYLALMDGSIGTEKDVINQDVILKPIKQSFHTACSFCLKPDVLLIRSRKIVGNDIKSRISKATCLSEEYILFDYDVESIYDVPEMLRKQGLLELIMTRFRLKSDVEVRSSLSNYARGIVKLAEALQYRVAIIGDSESWGSYTSLNEALVSLGVRYSRNICFDWFKSVEEYAELLENNASYKAFIVTEGIENPMEKAEMLRKILEYEKPVMCISYGACILANIIGLSTERTDRLVIGKIDTYLKDSAVGTVRDRHRRDFTIPICENKGENIEIIGCDSQHREIHLFRPKKYPYCIGVVSQPEYTSRPNSPNLLFSHLLNLNIEEELQDIAYESETYSSC